MTSNPASVRVHPVSGQTNCLALFTTLLFILSGPANSNINGGVGFPLNTDLFTFRINYNKDICLVKFRFDIIAAKNGFVIDKTSSNFRSENSSI